VPLLDTLTNNGVVRQTNDLYWTVTHQPFVNESSIRARFAARALDANGLTQMTAQDITFLTGNNVLHPNDVLRVQAHQRGGRLLYLENIMGRYRFVARQQA
jgi:hypothetical protein